MNGAPQGSAHEEGAPRSRLAELHPKRFFIETWQRMDEEAAEERRQRQEAGKGYDLRPLLVLCTGAAFLTFMEYFGSGRDFARIVGWLNERALAEGAAVPTFWSELRTSEFNRLYEYCWWSGWRVLGYFLLPCLVTWAMRERVRDHGLSFRGFSEHAWIYALCFAVVLPLVIAVSFTDEFAGYYPFYSRASRSWLDLLAWEVLYAAQFFSLEFFFRGWWLKACKSMMGSHAIFAMVVPYCMIHYGKPWLEALGAIIAGIVLGTLAMKTRSIWSGFLIHVSVAVSMDVAALLQKAKLPEQAFPG
jgi:membrane protease YdiL (CAAX protease family)